MQTPYFSAFTVPTGTASALRRWDSACRRSMASRWKSSASLSIISSKIRSSRSSRCAAFIVNLVGLEPIDDNRCTGSRAGLRLPPHNVFFRYNASFVMVALGFLKRFRNESLAHILRRSDAIPNNFLCFHVVFAQNGNELLARKRILSQNQEKAREIFQNPLAMADTWCILYYIKRLTSINQHNERQKKSSKRKKRRSCQYPGYP